MTDPSDVHKIGKSTWTRLRAKENKDGHTQRWFFRADSPEDDDEDVMMRDAGEMRWEIGYHTTRYDVPRPSRSLCETQQWTVYVNPTEIEGERVGVRDYVLRELGADIGSKCMYKGRQTFSVEISYTCFHVTVTDNLMREERLRQQCRVASLALLGVKRRLARSNTPQGASYTLVAMMLWRDYSTNEVWDRIPHWKISEAKAGAWNKRIKV